MKKLYVVCRDGEDDELNPVSIFYTVHTTQEKAEKQRQKLIADFGLPFVIIEAPLDP